MQTITSYRELLKKALDEAEKNGDAIIYCWPNISEYKLWEHRLDEEYFPAINTIASREEWVKLSWDGFPGPLVYAVKVKLLQDVCKFEAFVNECRFKNVSGPVTLIPSRVTLNP